MFDVASLMTRDVVTLKEDEDLVLADSVLKLGHIRHLPVVRDGRLVGLVTHRDLLRACGGEAGSLGRSLMAGEVMTRNVVTVSPTSSLRRATRTMLHNKFGCLPVVDSSGRLLGIVTEADLVRFAAQVLEELDKLDGARRQVIKTTELIDLQATAVER